MSSLAIPGYVKPTSEAWLAGPSEFILEDSYFGSNALEFLVKVWLGSVYANKPLKYWDGTAYRVVKLKAWNGTKWK